MYNTTAQYKEYIKKPSRDFECRVKIGNRIFTNTEVIEIVPETVQPNDGFSIGNTVSQSIDITLKNDGGVYASVGIIEVEIGLKIGNKIEYVPIGVFNIDDVEKTDYTVKLTCYDNMIKFETGYFEKYETPTLWQVIKQLEKTTGVQFYGIVPSYTVTKLSGYTCREILAYVASICGGNAFITRDGKFTIKVPKQIDYKITAANYFNTGYTSEDSIYKIGMITCKNKTNTDYTENEDYDSANDKNTISVGSLSSDTMELTFENPWVTENILNDIYSKLKDFSYLGYSMQWQGDMSLDVGDIVTVVDKNNVTRKAFIYANKLNYTGGLTAETSAKGETKNSNSFNASGKNISEIDRIVIKLLIAEQAIINKANIKDLQATNANISNLHATVADIATLVSGNLTSNNIHSLVLTSSKVTVENGFIKNAMVESLSADKITAGTLSTNKLTISSNDGGLVLSNNTMQFSDKDKNVRVQIGQDAKGDFNFIVKGADGKTVLIDSSGLHEGAISDGLIKTDMIADNAINSNKINYESVISGLNTDGSTYINASKVAIDLNGQTLDIAFNSVTNNINTNTTAISTMQGKISTLISNTTVTVDGKEKTLKDAYNGTVATVNSLKTTIGEHTSTINTLDGTVKSNTSKITTIQADLNNISATLSSTQSTVKTQTTQISNITTTANTALNNINNLQVGGRNIVLSTKFNEFGSNIVAMGSGNFTKAPFINKKDFNGINNSIEWKVSGLTENKWLGIGINTSLDGTTLSKGKTFTISFWYYVFSDTSCDPFTVCLKNHISNKSKLVKGIDTATKDKWIKFEYTGTLDEDLLLGNRTLYVYLNKNGHVKITKVKVEEGNKPTDWTPAPEDVDSSITNANNNANNALSTANKVSKDVATLTTTVTNTTSRVASLELTTNGLSTKIEETETTLTNLSIGGRNLAQKTSNKYSSFSSFNGEVNNWLLLAKVLTDGLSVGDTVTVRLVYKYTNIVAASGQTAKCWIQGSGNTTGWGPAAFVSSKTLTLNGSGEYEFLYNFKITANHLKNTYWDVTIRHDYVQSGSVQWKMFKVEKGTKATDWTPALEDVDSSIVSVKEYTTKTVSSLSTNLNGITARTETLESKTTNLESTVKSNVSEISTLKGKISLKVEQTDINKAINKLDGTVKENINHLSARIDAQAGEISHKVSANDVGTIITQSPTQVAMAIKNKTNSQAIFDSNGLTIENGKFRINKDGEQVLEIKSDGYVRSAKGFAVRYNDEDTMRFSRTGIEMSKNGRYWPEIKPTNSGIEIPYGDLELQDTTSNLIGSYIKIKRNGWIKRDLEVDRHVYVEGDLEVEGDKNCLQKTDNYGYRRISAYETAEYYFGDIGSGTIANGECIVYIEDIFKECVNTDITYQVFTQCYTGAIKKIDRFEDYFIVYGENGTEFGWELKAKRKGSENKRLEQKQEDILKDEKDYSYNLINENSLKDNIKREDKLIYETYLSSVETETLEDYLLEEK